MGPNDTRDIVWALGEYLFFLFKYFYTNEYHCGTGGATKWAAGRPATTKTGPSDASGVVWALGKIFKTFFVFFFYTN